MFFYCSVSGASANVYAYLSEFLTDQKRSRSIMIASIIFSTGSLLLPYLAFVVINSDWSLYISFLDLMYKPWRLFMFVCGIPGLICGIAIFYLPESPKFLLTMNKQEEAKEVLQRMYRINGGKDKLLVSIV